MLILMWKENEPGQGHIFQKTHFKSFQIHQVATIIYCFEYKNQDIHPPFYFFFFSKSLPSLFVWK